MLTSKVLEYPEGGSTKNEYPLVLRLMDTEFLRRKNRDPVPYPFLPPFDIGKHITDLPTEEDPSHRRSTASPTTPTTHRLLLNTYSNYPTHLLITTKKYEHQTESPVSVQDLRAIGSVTNNLPGAIAFLNVGLFASQPHKHFQVVLESELRAEILLENLSSGAAGAGPTAVPMLDGICIRGSDAAAEAEWDDSLVPSVGAASTGNTGCVFLPSSLTPTQIFRKSFASGKKRHTGTHDGARFGRRWGGDDCVGWKNLRGGLALGRKAQPVGKGEKMPSSLAVLYADSSSTSVPSPPACPFYFRRVRRWQAMDFEGRNEALANTLAETKQLFQKYHDDLRLNKPEFAAEFLHINDEERREGEQSKVFAARQEGMGGDVDENNYGASLADGGAGAKSRPPFSYNVIFARDWCVVIPRFRHGYVRKDRPEQRSTQNAMGFLGQLMFYDQASLDLVEGAGSAREIYASLQGLEMDWVLHH